MKRALLLLLFILFLFSCQKSSTIDPPINVMFDQATFELTWDEVPKATSYRVYIGDLTFESKSNIMDLSDLGEGLYVVKIRTLIEDNQSRYSSPISISIIKSLSLDISIIDDVISWIPIGQSTGYIVKIYDENNDLINEHSINQPMFSTSSLFGIYKFRISSFKDSQLQVEKEFILDTSTYIYSTNDTSFDFFYDMSISNIWIDGQLIPNNLYTIQSDTLIMNGDYLRNFNHTSHLIKIDSNNIPYYFNLIITEIKLPYMISDSNATFNGNDLIFVFELYDGLFAGITSTYPFLVDEYQFLENALIISSVYFQRIRSEHPNATHIVFTYLLTSGMFSQYGYIQVLLTD